MEKKELPASIIEITGGITAAAGFKATGIQAGIKLTGKPDLALLFSEKPCVAAGTFTRNAIRASSVDWCEKLLPSSGIHAVICNSGCANACTGERGQTDTELMAKLAGDVLGVRKEAVLVASTGVIGKPLPMEKIQSALPELSKKLSSEGGKDFSTAIMTTDTKEKQSAVRVETPQGIFSVGGTAKGSGMIHPNMATMLGFICTDARIGSELLDKTVKQTIDRTFNNLTVDGDTSTNDMVLVLANGASAVSISSESDLLLFEKALFTVCNDLCKQIAADGEGATKRVEINVFGAQNEKDAKMAAKAVATSNLTKCALFGNDPNWGRIACAVGYSGAQFSKEKISILLCKVPVFKGMQPVPFDESNLHNLLKSGVVTIDIDLGLGSFSAVAHTCDFSYDYVKINAEYRT
jgi:glutamate N-acetyltransferase/amino-acid N-acetyltransferase